ncbi:MAG TPA: class I mannose-6-phosphate isomerase, partial [Chitinophagaceae bacterium]|nr:class I mannose-6-phosphate isomerase [Chitinophagaceae bacterium]
ISKLGEKAAILGAASLLKDKDTDGREIGTLRKSNQPLLPLHRPDQNVDGYSLYPAFRLGEEKIHEGAGSLAEYILTHKTVVIDGYAGVFWDDLKQALQDCFKERGLEECISDTGNWFYPQEKINTLLAPFLGEKDGVWGTKCDKELSDLFDPEKIRKCLPDPTADINIVMGVGAAFAGWDAPLIYVDLPKNELQYRMRAGSVTNLGCLTTEEPVQMYKRFYFVDWVVLNKHKKALLDRIDIVADDQHPGTLTWMHGEDMRRALQTMSENVFRVRPWFEPGAWGGQWLKKRIEGINPEEVNYAWSFELITPENGLLFESDGLLLEVSFDFLMFAHHREILGQKFAERFGDEFPIRFDFLDTMSGGNLSIQCHPTVPYIKRYFGESFTQDETYYILDADEKAGVYLGFQEDVDAKAFRKELERSNEEHIPVEITRYVQRIAAKKHDLFLIPSGTVHSAAKGNLVLEISATPYIFTFKMYDWLRLDLNGDPRPINIAHAFNNLDFSRKGARVKEELISKPYPLNAGKDWKQIHLPTHPEHFYDVHRYEFQSEVRVETGGSPHVLMLVEGTSVLVETKNGVRQRYHYGETFVIPAAAENYRLINEGSGIAKVVTAFLK